MCEYLTVLWSKLNLDELRCPPLHLVSQHDGDMLRAIVTKLPVLREISIKMKLKWRHRPSVELVSG